MGRGCHNFKGCLKYMGLSYLKREEDKTLAETVVGEEAAVTHVGQDGGIFGHFCWLDNVHVLAVFRHI